MVHGTIFLNLTRRLQPHPKFISSFSCNGLVHRASASYAVGTWFDNGRDRCNQSLNILYRLVPLVIHSALEVLKLQRSSNRKRDEAWVKLMLLEARCPTKKPSLQKQFVNFIHSEDEMCPKHEVAFRIFPNPYSFSVCIS